MKPATADRSLEHLSNRVSVLELDSKNNRELLVRIDERTRTMSDEMAILRNSYVTRAEFLPVKETYISRDEYEPVKKVVFGMVALILGAVGTAVVAFFLRQ